MVAGEGADCREGGLHTWGSPVRSTISLVRTRASKASPTPLPLQMTAACMCGRVCESVCACVFVCVRVYTCACAAKHYAVLQHAALRCDALRCNTSRCCNMLRCVPTCGAVLQRGRLRIPPDPVPEVVAQPFPQQERRKVDRQEDAEPLGARDVQQRHPGTAAHRVCHAAAPTTGS